MNNVNNFQLWKHRERKIRDFFVYLVKILIGVLFISPIIIGFVFSLLPNETLFGVPSLTQIGEQSSLFNYKWVIENIPIIRYLINTFIVCLIVIISQVVISSLAGFAFAFFDFKGKNTIFNLVLVSMMIPAEVTVITNFLQVQSWGMVNKYIGLCITSLVGGTSVFQMRQFYLQLPRDYKDASVMDGCSDMRFLFRIAIPLSKPVIASLSIFLFINTYNMYFWPMLIAQKKEMQTIQLGMAMLVGTEDQQYGYILAGAMISIIIPVIAFIIGQDYIIRGMTAGGIKG